MLFRSTPRLTTAAEEQQVTAVERGYNLYQANCAQCHGANGEGGKGPVLNRQDKLFAHLSPDFIRNMLTVGGRYACGNATSIMPVWLGKKVNTRVSPSAVLWMPVSKVIARRAPSPTRNIVPKP